MFKRIFFPKIKTKKERIESIVDEMLDKKLIKLRDEIFLVLEDMEKSIESKIESELYDLPLIDDDDVKTIVEEVSSEQLTEFQEILKKCGFKIDDDSKAA